MRNLAVVTLATIFTVVASFAVITASMVYFGWALSVLWGWFVPPVFGLREISIPEVIGLMLIISLFRHREYKKKEPDYEWGDKLIAILVVPLVALLFGYITLQFI